MIPLYSSLVVLACLSFVGAAPFDTSAREILHLPLAAKCGHISIEEYIIAADNLRDKYGYPRSSYSKRDEIPITNDVDKTGHQVQITIGTQATPYHVIPDTGSVDLWIDDSKFDRSSSKFHLVGGQATIHHLSSSVTGDIAEDIVEFGGYTNDPQRLLLGTTFTTPLGSRQGVLGLPPDGASPASVLGTPPFWPSLRAKDSSIDSQLSFKFPPKPGSGSRETREVQHNDQSGGVLTVGGRNESLFTGDIEFLPLFSFNGVQNYWALPVIGVTVDGQSVALPPNGVASFDTSKPLIGAPADAVAAIWAKVPGSRPLDGDTAGFYGFPCDAVIQVCITFGGTLWPIDPQEINLGPLTDDPSTCVGAIFTLAPDALVPRHNILKPDWIIGVPFLRGLYSVFRSDPPAMGFAYLA